MSEDVLPNNKKLKVFLCHSSEDKPKVRELYWRLRADGFDPWLDEEDLLPGQYWEEEIEQAVSQADVVLVCLSHTAITTRNYVHKEMRYALDVADQQPDGTIFLIPLKLEECVMPLRLKRWQWVNFFDERGYEKLLRSLRLRAENLKIKSEPTQPNPPPNIPAVPPETPQAQLPQIQAEPENLFAEAPNWLKPSQAEIRVPQSQPPQQTAAPPIKPTTPPPAPKPVEETEQDRLLRELTDQRTDHQRRLAIGQRLNELGDKRPGVGVDQNGTPEILWLPVAPGGQITIEKERFNVPPFYIAKYLITYAQYEAFVKAKDGFNNTEWWQGMPKEYQQQKLDEQRTKNWNNPRDNVSWYQSVAFARWLNHRLRGQELLPPGGTSGSLIVGKNAEVRLPLEWEWQWAAQGGSEQRKYPWGNWKEGYTNTKEAGLGQTVAVGMYPQGTAICGAEDMSGQLWEWCQNEYDNPKTMIVNKSTKGRVLRGGAFRDLADDAACAFRFNRDPFFDLGYWGFRVVVGSSPIAPSGL